LVRKSRTDSNIVAQGLLDWSAGDEDSLERQAAAFRVAECINLIALALTKKNQP